MATANVCNELEHFVNCGVCLCEFDDDTRKPKFLQCCHTICLKCLKKICRRGSIKCPFCRKNFNSIQDISSLPNNSYALHMIKLKDEKPTVSSCGSTGQSSQGTIKLSAVLEKRKKVEAQLELIMKSITAAGDELEKLQEENHLEMAELISVIELSPAKATENAICLPLTSAPAASPIPFPFSITNVVQPRPPYVFILKVSNQNGPVGQIRIRPAPKFHPEFVQKLGEFCYKTPTNFSSNINKSQPGLFVLLSMSRRPYIPTLEIVNHPFRITALKFGEVGLISKINRSENRSPISDNASLTEWDFFFPLIPVNYQQKLVISSTAAELFGHIINTSIHSPAFETVMEMSKSKKNEREHFQITIESDHDSLSGNCCV